MFRLMILLLSSFLLAACATNPAVPTALGASGDPLAGPHGTPSPVSPAPESAGWVWTDPAPERFPVDGLEAMAFVPQRRGDSTNDYTMIKGGFYEPDSGSLDDGYIVNLAFGHYFTQFLALELEIGYLNSEGSPASLIDTIRGAPLMANARVSVPVWILEVYGGGGVGAIYYDIEGVFSVLDTDGWLFAGNFFFGADLDLSDTIFLGVEAKYYLTEDLGSGDLDALAVFATLGVRY